jgi:trehalose utilization protein
VTVPAALPTDRPIRVLVWNEYFHERQVPLVGEIYPEGIHATVAGALRDLLGDRVEVRTAVLDDPEHGLTEEALADTDVLLWWAHRKHADVADEVADRVRRRVLEGMGYIPLHSAHYSKPFRLLMGTSCLLNWREIDDSEYVWTVAPSHPIAAGLPQPIVIPKQEMYGEYFDIPAPDELVFISSYSKSVEVFRSGCTWRRGRGRVFYFSPGHEAYPVFHQPEIQRVLANAVLWAFQPEPSEVPVLTQGVSGPKPMLIQRDPSSAAAGQAGDLERVADLHDHPVSASA